jgi:hypothetical protein
MQLSLLAFSKEKRKKSRCQNSIAAKPRLPRVANNDGLMSGKRATRTKNRGDEKDLHRNRGRKGDVLSCDSRDQH